MPNRKLPAVLLVRAIAINGFGVMNKKTLELASNLSLPHAVTPLIEDAVPVQDSNDEVLLYSLRIGNVRRYKEGTLDYQFRCTTLDMVKLYSHAMHFKSAVARASLALRRWRKPKYIARRAC